MADALAKLRDRKIQRLLERLPQDRSCEGCDLCCTAVGVRELGKPPSVACEHLCGAPGASCGIYETRPRSCREFYCMWRAMVGFPEDFRPADCGFVVSINDPNVHPMVVTVHPDPARPDAWDTIRARRFFLLLAQDWNCLVAIGQGELAHTIFAPQGYVFTKDSAPELFIDGGNKIGAPDFLFAPSDKPTRNRRPASSQIGGSIWSFE
jgi:hypothetical protein